LVQEFSPKTLYSIIEQAGLYQIGLKLTRVMDGNSMAFSMSTI
jgi:hypothetical protein